MIAKSDDPRAKLQSWLVRLERARAYTHINDGVIALVERGLFAVHQALNSHDRAEVVSVQRHFAWREARRLRDFVLDPLSERVTKDMTDELPAEFWKRINKLEASDRYTQYKSLIEDYRAKADAMENEVKRLHNAANADYREAQMAYSVAIDAVESSQAR